MLWESCFFRLPGFFEVGFYLMKATLTVSCSLRSARLAFGPTRCLVEFFQKGGPCALLGEPTVPPDEQYWGEPTVPPGVVPGGDYLVEGRAGVKGEFCPAVSGFCPGVTGILSRSVPVFVTVWPDRRGRTSRTGANCSSGKPVKNGGDSGAAVVVVRQMQCINRPLAREPDGDKHTVRQEAIKGKLFSGRSGRVGDDQK